MEPKMKHVWQIVVVALLLAVAAVVFWLVNRPAPADVAPELEQEDVAEKQVEVPVGAVSESNPFEKTTNPFDSGYTNPFQ